MKLSEIKKLDRKISEAQEKHCQAVATLVNKIVIIEKGRSQFQALVIDIGYGGDIFIRNFKTGKEYRISSYHVKEIL